MFVDQTASIERGQRRLWAHQADTIVRRLRAGWTITVYAIHDHTMDAAPLFDGEIPATPPDSSIESDAKQSRAIKQIRTGLQSALSGAFEPERRAMRTDILSAIDRITPDPKGRDTSIIFFSDMNNSTGELNMERPGTVTRSSMATQIERIARAHSWGPEKLKAMEVYCVLTSVEHGPRPVIDRLSQREFYELLFRALGGHLETYDTHLGSTKLTGGSYAAE
jgi:hypothetical protein